MPILYHYTSGFGLAGILTSRTVQPSTDHDDQPAAVWFTTSDKWEDTCRQPLEGILNADWGRWRLRVDTERAPYTFVSFEAYSFDHPEVTQLLAIIGRSVGSDPARWWLTRESISLVHREVADWLEIEHEEPGCWRVVPRWQWLLSQLPLFSEPRKRDA